jgi:hypothetical protein
MRISRTRLLCSFAALLLAGLVAPASAELSNVEQAAALSGRVMGAAKACGLNAERIRRTSDRLMTVLGSKASAEEMHSAKRHFAAMLPVGAEAVRGEHSRCTAVHVEFSEIEVKLGRSPLASPDPLAVKRGVPALGALKP